MQTSINLYSSVFRVHCTIWFIVKWEHTCLAYSLFLTFEYNFRWLWKQYFVITFISRFEAIRGSGTSMWMETRRVVGSIPTGNNIFNTFISLLYKHKSMSGAKFHHLPRNASIIWGKMENGSVDENGVF